MSLRANPETMRQYKREWVARRRAAWFADKCCAGCGSTDQLELDHKDPSMKLSNAIWSWSASRREAELAKCQVLCRGCHQRKTVGEMFRPRVHGTVAMYKRGKCRCRLCREAKRRYVAAGNRGATLIFVRPSDLRRKNA